MNEEIRIALKRIAESNGLVFHADLSITGGSRGWLNVEMNEQGIYVLHIHSLTMNHYGFTLMKDEIDTVFAEYGFRSQPAGHYAHSPRAQGIWEKLVYAEC